MAGGSYLVVRRIRMHIEVWDRSTLQDQEQTIGRDKKEGAPLGQRGEFTEPDFRARAADGAPQIPVDSHVALAHPDHLGGIRILRRGYTFTDGTDGQGHLDAGLFFVAFARDAHRQFVPMQRALARADRMNEYVEHTGSALFACPPGLGDGAGLGRTSSSAEVAAPPARPAARAPEGRGRVSPCADAVPSPDGGYRRVPPRPRGELPVRRNIFPTGGSGWVGPSAGRTRGPGAGVRPRCATGWTHDCAHHRRPVRCHR